MEETQWLEGQMYKCELCQKVVPAGTKAHRIPVEFRPREYPARKKANRVLHLHKHIYIDDPGGHGFEIVREVTACPDCAAQHRQT